MRDRQRVKITTKEFIPEYVHEGDAGFDLKAYLPNVNDLGITLKKGETMIVPTGIAMDIPYGYEIQLRSRSGLTSKHGIVVGQGTATIDYGWTSDIGMIIRNEGSKDFVITHGMKLCQGVLAPVSEALFEVVPEIKKDTTRGDKGYGSSGIH